jgi:hypothetical protein
MKKTLGFLAINLSFAALPTLGQTVQATVGVGANNAILCQQTPPPTATAPVTSSCPSTNWSDGSGNSGSGNGTATASYGSLQSVATAKTTATVSSGASGLSTATTTGTSFTDYLTFPSLSTAANLKATVTVSGSASGNLLASSIVADVNLSGGSFGQCVITAATGGSCTTSVQVSPGDRVQVDGGLNLNASTNIAPNSAGSDSATLNYNGKKGFGAQYAFVIVDAAGKAISGVKVVAASGTKYPMR